LLNVHKINKQDTQNNTCITPTGVKLKCSKCLPFTQIHVRRHRSSAVSVHRRHGLARPAAALLYFYSQSVLLGGKRSGKMNTGVSFQKADCPTRSVSRNIALLEDKELATDLMHDRQ